MYAYCVYLYNTCIPYHIMAAMALRSYLKWDCHIWTVKEKRWKVCVYVCMGLDLMNASHSPGRPGSWVNHDVIPLPVTMGTIVNDVIAVSVWPSFACRADARLTWNHHHYTHDPVTGRRSDVRDMVVQCRQRPLLERDITGDRRDHWG